MSKDTIVDVMDEFPPERVDVVAQAMLSAGALVIGYVGFEMGVASAEAYVEYNEPNVATKKKTSYIGAVWRTLKHVVKEHTAALPVLVLAPWPITTAAAAIAAYQRWKRENPGPEGPGEAAALAALRRLQRLEMYMCIGVMLISAGGAWWISRHPEVVTTMITVMGEVAKVGINELSELVEALTKMIPGISGLITAMGV